MCRRRNVGKPWKSTFSIAPLSFDASYLHAGNPRKYPHKPYGPIVRNYSHWAASSSLIVHSNFRGGLRKTHVFWNRVRNGPSRSSKVVDFGTSRKRVSEILKVCCWEHRPYRYYSNFGVFLLDYTTSRHRRCCGSKMQRPYLIIRAINFELVQPTGWPKLKYPSSKFAISWQQHKILRPILQQLGLLSANQWINPQNYPYTSLKRQIYSIAKVKAPFSNFTVWRGLRQLSRVHQ